MKLEVVHLVVAVVKFCPQRPNSLFFAHTLSLFVRIDTFLLKCPTASLSSSKTLWRVVWTLKHVFLYLLSFPARLNGYRPLLKFSSGQWSSWIFLYIWSTLRLKFTLNVSWESSFIRANSLSSERVSHLRSSSWFPSWRNLSDFARYPAERVSLAMAHSMGMFPKKHSFGWLFVESRHHYVVGVISNTPSHIEIENLRGNFDAIAFFEIFSQFRDPTLGRNFTVQYPLPSTVPP